MTQPLNPYSIDVVIPVYNGERYIIDAIASVDRQTYRPERIIVVDDGSTDNTEGLVSAYRGSTPIDYIKKPNGGLSSARNAGIQRCTADLVALLDADDEWIEDKLEKQVEVFLRSEFDNLAIVYCKYLIIDENGELSTEHHVTELDPTLRGQIFEKLLGGNLVTSSASGVLVRRDCFNQAGLFDETLKAAEDWDMWLRIAQSYEFDYVGQILVKIRRHSQNMQKDYTHMFRNELLFFQKWAARIPKELVQSQGWAGAIVDPIFRRLPEIELLGIARNLLNKRTKKILFHQSLGSIQLYLILRLVKTMIWNIFRTIRDTLRAFYHLFKGTLGCAMKIMIVLSARRKTRG